MPARLRREDVARIAALACLELPDADRDRLARELAGILTFAGQIATVDTRDVEIAAATASPAGFFTVPRVLG